MACQKVINKVTTMNQWIPSIWATSSRNSQALVKIGLRDRWKIYFFAIFYGIWVCVKSLLMRVWRLKKISSNSNVINNNNAKHNLPLASDLPATGTHCYIKINNIKFHYVEMGEACNPPVLLLHGFPDYWAGWREQLIPLSVTHRVIALDLQGCGDTDRPVSRYSYTPHRVLDPVKVLLKTLATQYPHKPAVLIGHDLGALLGWFIVHEAPDLISKFVAVSCPHPNIYWDNIQHTSPFNNKWMMTAQLPWLVEHIALRNNIQLLEKCHSHLNTSNGTNSNLVLDTYKYVFSRHSDWSGPINYFRNFIFWRIDQSTERIDVPTLLITGNKDPQVSLESMVRSSEWCTRGLVKIVNNAGHFPQQESPHYFNRILLDFIITEKTTQNGIPFRGAAKGIVGRVFGAVNLFS